VEGHWRVHQDQGTYGFVPVPLLNPDAGWGGEEISLREWISRALGFDPWAGES
jgi:hypothetical protein